MTILDIYPVGSVYISLSATFDPNTSFGGTWERFGVGKCLWGVGPKTNEVGTDLAGTLPNIKGNLSGAGNIALFDRAANENNDNLFSPKDYNADNVVSLWSIPHEYPDADYTGKQPIILKNDSATGLEIRLNPSCAKLGGGEFNDVEFNAHECNSKYADGAVVRPESVGVIFWKRTA